MAGSYRHATTPKGKLRNPKTMIYATENVGDAYETIEEMYGMIWYLAHGEAALVEGARKNYKVGIEWSPGRQQVKE